MSGRALLVFAFAMMVCAPGKAFCGTLTDIEIRQKILGSWTVAQTSPDYAESSPYGVETFHPDGTYTTTLYTSSECKVRLQQITVGWSVSGGILISALPNGGHLNDQVLSIVKDTMTLHSLEDGTTYMRTKVEDCEKPVS